jgi:hypothetical protein
MALTLDAVERQQAVTSVNSVGVVDMGPVLIDQDDDQDNDRARLIVITLWTRPLWRAGRDSPTSMPMRLSAGPSSRSLPPIDWAPGMNSRSFSVATSVSALCHSSGVFVSPFRQVWERSRQNFRSVRPRGLVASWLS